MRFTYNQYNCYESGYRIPSKMHHNNSNSSNSNSSYSSNNSNNSNSSNNNIYSINSNSMHSNNHYNGNLNSLAYHHQYYKSNFGMRTTMSTMSTMSPRIHRKGFRTPSKRHPGKAFPGKLHPGSRIGPGKLVPGKRFPPRPHPPPCDNSNDSGFGFDQHVEIQQQQQQQQQQHQQQQQLQTSNPITSTNISSNLSTTNINHHQQQHHHQHQQQQHQHQQQQTSPQQNVTSSHQQGSPPLSSLNSSSNSSSPSSSSSGTSSSSIQNSPQQQHLIRAIPASRSRRPAKRLPFLSDDNDNSDTDDEDFCTDDSDDYGAGKQRRNLTASSNQQQNATQSYSSAGFNHHSHHSNSNNNHHHHHHHNHSNNYHSTHGIKRKKMEMVPTVDLDNDDACSEDAFIRKIATATTAPAPAPQPPPPPPPIAAPTKFIASNGRGMTRVAHKRQPLTPPNSVATSSSGRVQLEIISQPEQQHRARYQTEGSRGAVKDRSGNGFPIVRLGGYNKPTTLQVFIGTDVGRVAPHMFYQACKVAGKNSTQCSEKKVDGTVVIEIDFKPEQEMTITCDCVGILKERNVDVEHRFPEHLAQKNKKKSTRCRMVFRTQLANDDGTVETLQVCSNPIICTQPPGVPEICKKSLNSCPADGGLELFIIGKNFLKDTFVIFQETYETNANDELNTSATASDITNIRQQMIGALWEQSVVPDKEYLQQTHLICTVPPYIHQNIMKPVTVQVLVVSSGKKSEAHTFSYTPKGTYTPLAAATTLGSLHISMHNNNSGGGGGGGGVIGGGGCGSGVNNASGTLSTNRDPTFMDTTPAGLTAAVAASVTATANSMWPQSETKHEIDADMMPPPITTQMPMVVRRPSLNNAQSLMADQQLVHLNAAAEALKTELLDESSQNSIADAINSPETVVACAAAAAAAVAAVGAGVAAEAVSPTSPTALQFHNRYARKASLDTMMYDSNSMTGFPVAPAPATSTPMEVAAVAAAVELAVKNELAKAVSVAKVDKFITDLAKSANVTDTTGSVVEPSIFSVANTTAIDNALTDILQQAAVNNVQPAATAAAAAAAGAAAAVLLERSLSNSSATSSSSSGSPMSGNSPVNSLTNHNSPITQDVILNSEPSLALTAALPIAQLMPSATAPGVSVNPEVTVTSAAGLSTDIIMNPSVSPSTILCSDNGAATAVVPNIMAPHQVTMANSILNDIAMQAQPTQQDATVAALALSNIIMTPPSDSTSVTPVTPASMQPEVTSATSTAVSNMIIKAAADFISNQEQQTQQHHQHQQQQQQHQHQHRQHHHHHRRSATHQQQSPTSQQQLLNGQSVTTDRLNPLNLLLTHGDVSPTTQATVASASSVAENVPSQFPLAITSPPQESLIVALATENALQKSVTAAAITTNGAVVTQETSAPASTPNLHPATAAAVGAVAAAAAAAAVPLAPIPQELTAMSDQDLLSYINPSTFDQV